jgi:hypothetical protein
LPFCNTDQDLFYVATAASYNGKSAWIAAVAAADQASSLVWRQRRGVLLAGLAAQHDQVTVMTGPERRRQWDDDVRNEILASSFSPGAVVAEVARRFDVASKF